MSKKDYYKEKLLKIIEENEDNEMFLKAVCEYAKGMEGGKCR